MRKALFVLLLVFAGNCEASNWADWLVGRNTFGEWIVVDQRQSFIIYADTGSIRTSNSVARMWEMTDFVTQQGMAQVSGSKSLKIEREYDCQREQMRTLYVAHYSENMGQGEVVGSDRDVGPWQPIMLGTIGNRLWRIACNKR